MGQMGEFCGKLTWPLMKMKAQQARLLQVSLWFILILQKIYGCIVWRVGESDEVYITMAQAKDASMLKKYRYGSLFVTFYDFRRAAVSPIKPSAMWIALHSL